MKLVLCPSTCFAIATTGLMPTRNAHADWMPTHSETGTLNRGSCFIAIAAAVILVPGCGTIANLDGTRGKLFDLPSSNPPIVFGGVAHDCIMMTAAFACLFDQKCDCLLPIFPVFSADLPFSIVGDIVTLAKVLYMRYQWYRGQATGQWPDWVRERPGDVFRQAIRDGGPSRDTSLPSNNTDQTPSTTVDHSHSSAPK
jgi:hypothetical protein